MLIGTMYIFPTSPLGLLYGPLYAAFSMDPSAFDANAKAELGAIDGVEARRPQPLPPCVRAPAG